MGYRYFLPDDAEDPIFHKRATFHSFRLWNMVGTECLEVYVIIQNECKICRNYLVKYA